jgi:maltose O-acetyltransferase
MTALRDALPEHIYNLMLRGMPTRLGKVLRRGWLVRSGADLAPNVILNEGVRVLGAARLRAETGVVIARDVCVDSRGGVTLRQDALVGLECLLLTSTHNFEAHDKPVQAQGMWLAPITIGERTWIGARVIVFPGVSIGADSVVGAGSVVTRDVPARSVAVGVPARVVRSR